MSAAPRPPRLARALLRWRLGGEAVGQSIRGDLWQEYVERRQSAGRLRASLWYWRESVGVLRPRAFHPARPGRRLRGWAHDARDAARSLRRSPSYSVLAIGLLALGITATTMIFTVVNALFLKPPPLVRQPAELVQVYTSDYEGRRFGVSAYPDFADMRERVPAFVSTAAFQLGYNLRLSLDDQVRALFGVAVSAEYFATLGVEPELGRGFAPDEVGVAAVGDVVVLGHRTWTDVFDADPEILGREIRANGRLLRVVGVAPVGLQAPGFPVVPGGYVPLAGPETGERGSRSLGITARLAPGADLGTAQAQLDALAAAVYEESPRTFSDQNERSRRFSALPERDARLSPENRTTAMAFMAMLLAGVGAVLLIACSNLAHLALVRAGARGSALAVRRALGAAQGRLVRLLLIETVLVGVASAGVSLVVVTAASRLVPRLNLFPAGIVLEAGVDWRVLLFGTLVGVGTGALFGLLPARRVARMDLTPLLHSGASGGVIGRRGRLASALLLVQVAVSVALVVLSGLFFRSLQGAVSADIGFEPEGIAVVQADLSQVDMDAAEGLAAFDAMRVALAQRPDVESVVLANRVPLAGGWERSFIEVEDYTAPDGETPQISTHRISDGYFEQMRIPVLRGREFTPDDRQAGRPVVVVNDVFERTYWSEGEALGRHVSRGSTSYEVIGVVAETRGRQLAEEPLPQVWFSVYQDYRPAMMLQARTRSPVPTGEFLAEMRSAVLDVTPGLPVLDPVWMPSMTANATLPQRIASSVLGTAGALAMLLAAVGLHGVIGFGVAQRVPEIGLRMALGADARSVFRTVFGRAVLLVGAGALVGAGLAVAAAQGARDLLVGVSPLDPVAIVLAAVCLVAVSAAAALGPVRRATTVDPVKALRSE